jgi:formylglycine-generating enzyme required for sulfatase activity
MSGPSCRFALCALTGFTLAVLLRPAGAEEIREPIEARGRIEFDAEGQLLLHYDLPEGESYRVDLIVDLGGREPSLHRTTSFEGDVGDAIPGGPGKIAIWDAWAGRRRLTGRETAWVVAVPAALILPILRDGPLADMKFAHVPAGTFRMGSPPDEHMRSDNEGPVVERTVGHFEMLCTEVTQRDFESVMGFNHSRMKAPDRPVENVTWFDAVAFCEKLEELDPSYLYRLPTEAEWEYACRSGTDTPFYWVEEEGQDFPEGAVAMRRYGWHYGNSGGKTRPVAQKEANAWGLHDMHGNVWEWCLDEYTDRHSATPPLLVTSPASWPPAGRPASPRVVRGGSWLQPAHQCRAAIRRDCEPDEKKKDVGFRVVRLRWD